MKSYNVELLKRYSLLMLVMCSCVLGASPSASTSTSPSPSHSVLTCTYSERTEAAVLMPGDNAAKDFVSFMERIKRGLNLPVLPVPFVNVAHLNFSEWVNPPFDLYWKGVVSGRVIAAAFAMICIFMFVSGLCCICICQGKPMLRRQRYLALIALTLISFLLIIFFSIYAFRYNQRWSEGIDYIQNNVTQSLNTLEQNVKGALTLVDQMNSQLPKAVRDMRKLAQNDVGIRPNLTNLLTNLYNGYLNQTIGTLQNTSINNLLSDLKNISATTNLLLVSLNALQQKASAVQDQINTARNITVDGTPYIINGFPNLTSLYPYPPLTQETITSIQNAIDDRANAFSSRLNALIGVDLDPKSKDKSDLKDLLWLRFNATVLRSANQTAKQFGNAIADRMDLWLNETLQQLAKGRVKLVSLLDNIYVGQNATTFFITTSPIFSSAREPIIIIIIVFLWGLVFISLLATIVVVHKSKRSTTIIFFISQLLLLGVVIVLCAMFIHIFTGSIILSDFCINAEQIAEYNLSPEVQNALSACQRHQLFEYIFPKLPSNLTKEYEDAKRNQFGFGAYFDYMNLANNIDGSLRNLQNDFVTILQRLPFDQANGLYNTASFKALFAGSPAENLNDLIQRLYILQTVPVTQLTQLNQSLSVKTAFGFDPAIIDIDLNSLNQRTLPFNYSYSLANLSLFDITAFPPDNQTEINQAYQVLTGDLKKNQSLTDALVRVRVNIQLVNSSWSSVLRNELPVAIDNANHLNNMATLDVDIAKYVADSSILPNALGQALSVNIRNTLALAVPAYLDKPLLPSIYQISDPLMYQVLRSSVAYSNCTYVVTTQCNLIHAFCLFVLPGMDVIVFVFAICAFVLALVSVVDGLIALFMARERIRKLPYDTRQRLFDEDEEPTEKSPFPQKFRQYEDDDVEQPRTYHSTSSSAPERKSSGTDYSQPPPRQPASQYDTRPTSSSRYESAYNSGDLLPPKKSKKGKRKEKEKVPKKSKKEKKSGLLSKLHLKKSKKASRVTDDDSN